MYKTVIAVLVALALTSVFSIAQEKRGDVLVIPDGTPEEYVVKEGDTLWDISELFFGDPLTWPRVWKKNEFIADPHWIFPGQTLMFYPKPPPPPAPAPIVIAPAPAPEPVVVEAPVVEVIAEPVPEPVVEIDPNVLRLLQRPRPIFSTISFMKTGYIAKRADVPKTKVVALESGVTATRFDHLTIEARESDNFNVGEYLAIMDVEDEVKHPGSGDDLGHVLRVKAVAKVLSVATTVDCSIIESFDPVSVNDIVTRAHIRKSPDFDAWMKPDSAISGIILARERSIQSIHQNDILYIDAGTNKGVRPGDRFAVYAGGSQSLIGELQAVNVMARETAVLVISIKGEKLAIGDNVKLTARVRLVENSDM